jgi:hypothetical protein
MDDRAGLFRPGWIAKSSVYGLGDRTASGSLFQYEMSLKAGRISNEK